MPNFALESQGARVIADLSSDTHWTKERTWNILDILTYNWYSEKKHRTVIQGRPSLNPGECWPFKGDQGHLFISLSHPVNISHVTLGHITERQSPTGTIPSAPREFSVYGFTTTDDKGVFLGGHVYERDGPAYQTFTMPNPNIGVFGYVKLVIENNWGEKNHTCVYTFKVHGTIPT
ncbi:SUN domain-containing protein 3-like [Halichoeres trimaculatus]|uniref:SUN domain-containing protein 3-like n=1 Tax=Halichoeres trimaculatus TaxID=147232 RepID=UPI003D9E46E2